VLENWITS